jgi:23S rRNA (cytosine1962-C5)-methyltransferase
LIPAARLRPRRPERARHPWIFEGEVAAIPPDVADGDVVTVLDHRGAFFARAYCNRKSKIVLRVLTWTDEIVDAAWWRRRVGEAIARRGAQPHDAAMRLVNAEGDGLPGLIVDRYGPWLAVQISTLGVERAREAIVAALGDALPSQGIYERSDLP